MMKCPFGKGMRWWREKHGLEFIMDLVFDYANDKDAEYRGVYAVENGDFMGHTLYKTHIS